ncbi:MAG: ribonuclease H [Bacteroidaceae bacterium]|nr:ribonuclease H [Bacteroidaceae bacterium]MDE6158892.1 ribonuclease H [Bacteroidaceae bacterium]
MEETREAWCVDASCSGNPGPMEYQCVHLPSRQRVFHFGPIPGTNNIGEFLAIVHALALQRQRGIRVTIYSDSMTAQTWVRNRKAKTTLKRTPRTAQALDLLARAEKWIQTYGVNVPIQKWNTEEWGEIPADFGRK